VNAAPTTAQAEIDVAVMAERLRIVGILRVAGQSPELVLMARRCIDIGLSQADASRLMAVAPHASNRAFWAAIADMVNGGSQPVQSSVVGEGR
jgi:aminoglycoside/choline kinase family phosphotransferase